MTTKIEIDQGSLRYLARVLAAELQRDELQPPAQSPPAEYAPLELSGMHAYITPAGLVHWVAPEHEPPSGRRAQWRALYVRKARVVRPERAG